MNAIILAGGKSSRFGSDKAFVRIEGTSLIKKQVKLLKKLFKKIIIVTNSPDKYKIKGVKVIGDLISGFGPLSGIHAGLLASDSHYNFIVGCDMPFLNQGLIRYMISKCEGFDIVAPRLKKGYEPLFAVYSRNCIPTIENILSKDNFKVRQLFKKVKVKQIREREINKFAEPETIFFNINTLQDLCRITTSPKK